MNSEITRFFNGLKPFHPVSAQVFHYTMRCLVFGAISLLTSCVTEFQPAPGVTVPADLESAYLELDNMLDNKQKSALREGEIEVEELVLTFGMQLKEYWGLWQDSKIAKYLRKRDIEHPDQMITVIFEGYVEYLRNQ